MQVLTDTMTTVWYCNKQSRVGSVTGGPVPMEVARPAANHLAGVLNAWAGELSRLRLADHEWHLNPELVRGFFVKWGKPRLDYHR